MSAVDRILRYDEIEKHLSDPPAPVVITDQLPKDMHHGWKYLAFGPDGKLYVAVGVPCNICEPDFARYGHIARMNPDGSGYEVVARGIRNSVGFDWDPSNKQLWFTDNGRDWLGDDQPPDELNHASSDGLHFGYPYCHGNAIADPEFGKQRPCSAFRAPALELGPHVASLGMRFYSGSMFPPEISRAHLYCRTWLVESQQEDRVSHYACHAGQRRAVAVLGVRRRVAARRASMGTAGGHSADARRCPVNLG